MSQTPALVPADRVLYALRDRTGTVESPGLICASILSKKLAAGLDALVLDVKTGSGAFLRKREDAEYLAALMVATAEAAGTRTVALLTDMGQPLGSAAGNWIEMVECVELLRGERPARQRRSPRAFPRSGRLDDPSRRQGAVARSGLSQLAEAALTDGSALAVFLKMVDAHGGDVSVFDDPDCVSQARTRRNVLDAWESGYIAEMDTTALGWAVQRTGAGREKSRAETGRSPCGNRFPCPARRRVEKGQPLATLYATTPAQLAEPIDLLQQAIRILRDCRRTPVPLIQQVFTREKAEAYLADAAKVGKTVLALGSASSVHAALPGMWIQRLLNDTRVIDARHRFVAEHCS